MNDIYIDIDVEFLFVDRMFLTVRCSNYVNYVFRKSKLLKVNNISFIVLIIDKYISIDFFIFNKIDSEAAIVCFTRHVHIVDNFKINLFLNNNILKSKNIILYVSKRKLIINSCGNFVVLLQVIIKNNERVKCVVQLQVNVIILTYICILIFIKLCNDKLSNRDIMFNFNYIERLNKKKCSLI